MIKECLVCGKEFKTYKSKILLGKGKYCSKTCCLKMTSLDGKKGQRTRFKKDQKPHNFKGWRYHISRRNGKKYIERYRPKPPFCSKAGYVKEHRLVYEEEIGRYLNPDELVHHVNGDTLDNALKNLVLVSKLEHLRLHTKDNIHKRWNS